VGVRVPRGITRKFTFFNAISLGTVYEFVRIRQDPRPRIYPESPSKAAETCSARTRDPGFFSSIWCTRPWILSAQSNPCLLTSTDRSQASIFPVASFFLLATSYSNQGSIVFSGRPIFPSTYSRVTPNAHISPRAPRLLGLSTNSGGRYQGVPPLARSPVVVAISKSMRTAPRRREKVMFAGLISL